MAEKRVIELEVKENFKKVENDLDSLNQALKETATANRDVNKTFEEVYGDLQPLTTRLGEAEDRLYELAAAGDTTSKEYKDLLSTVANYRKVQISTDMVVDAASTTMSTKMVNAIGGVANAFSVAEGATALMGVESEDLQKTMVKLQAAMSIAQGLQGLKEGGLAFKQLGSSALSALKGIKAGVAATGVGLLIIAVGLLIANFDKLKSTFSSTLSKAKDFEKTTNEQAEAARKAVENFGEYERTLKRLGYTEEDINTKRRERFKDAIKRTKSEIEASKKVYEEQLKNLKTVQAWDKFGMNATGRMLFGDEEDAKDQRKKVTELRDQLAKLKNDQFQFEEDIKAKKKQSAEEEKQKQQELIDKEKERVKAIKDRVNEELETLKQYYFDARELLKDDYTRTIDEINRRYDEEVKLAKKYGKDTTILEQARQDEIAKATHENNAKNILSLQTLELEKIQIKRDSNLVLQGELNAEVQAEMDAAMRKQQVLEAQAIKAKQIDEKSHSFKIEATKSALETISSITELFAKKGEAQARRAFGIQKAANIASALMTTYQNATSAYASQFVPIPDPSSPIRGGVAAGIAVATGLVNVAKIASQKFDGGGSMSGSAPSGDVGGGTINAPNFNVIGNSGVNQLAQIQQQPTRAYVVSGDVANGLSLERNRLQNASF